uniref:Endo/exonuclease/phosphatase domain-containing protein n=1 Tax=Caenorhabditis japonica TaxID=281687 RepID=A0A8R1E6Y9_CAEJA
MRPSHDQVTNRHLLTWIVNGWARRNSELGAIISKEKPDVVCLQETKIDTAQAGYTPIGFETAMASRNKHGGIGDLLITNVYFPLRSSDSPTAEVREGVLQILDMEDQKHILTGDWNAHYSAWHTNAADKTRTRYIKICIHAHYQLNHRR